MKSLEDIMIILLSIFILFHSFKIFKILISLIIYTILLKQYYEKIWILYYIIKWILNIKIFMKWSILLHEITYILVIEEKIKFAQLLILKFNAWINLQRLIHKFTAHKPLNLSW